MRYLLPRVVAVLLMGAAMMWGAQAYRQYAEDRALFGCQGPKNGAPDPDAICALGEAVVPRLCCELSFAWCPADDPVGAQEIAWIRALGCLRDRRGTPPLVAMTDDSDATVRLYCVLAMRQILDERSLPALKRLTKDADPRVAFEACAAVEDINGNEATFVQ